MINGISPTIFPELLKAVALMDLVSGETTIYANVLLKKGVVKV